MQKILFTVLIFSVSSFTLYDKAYSLKFVKAATGRSRFGDCLSIVYVANYIADKYKIPVLYQDFVESKKLLIQDKIDEIKQYNINPKKFKIVRVNNENQVILNNFHDVIYEVRIDFILKDHYNRTIQKKLMEKFRNLIRPKNAIKTPCVLNEDDINIAVHVRKGGGFDLPLLSRDGLFEQTKKDPNFKPIDAGELRKKHQNGFSYSDLRWPHKFPPDSYFVEQIKKVATLFPQRKLHVHIFTDDQNSELLMNKYIKVINDNNITFSCRKENNAYDKNIIDDFFAMTKFDCLIRPASTYSQNIEILGDFKIIIWPEHSTWIDEDLLVIDKVNIINNNV